MSSEAITLDGLGKDMQQLAGILSQVERNTAVTAKASSKTEYNTRGILFHWIFPVLLGFVLYVAHEVTVRVLPAHHPYAEFADKADSFFRLHIKSLMTEPEFKVWSLPRPKGKDISKLHPHLQNTVLYATQLAKKDGYTFYVTSAHRSFTKQMQLIREGLTDTKNSRHLLDQKGVAYAVDITLYASGLPSKKKYALINQYMQTAAKSIGTQITWGGTYEDYDGVHYTLKKSLYQRNSYNPIPTNYPRFQRDQLTVMEKELFRTESQGKGDYVAVNRFGYLGRYQFGLSALCEVGGFIKPHLCTKGINGRTQKPYLENPKNWLIAGGQDAFLDSKAMQQRAFKDLMQYNIIYLTDKGILSPNSDPVTLACIAKAAWLGPKKAVRYFKYGKKEVDGNGTSLAKYCEDGKHAMRQHLAAAGSQYQYR